MGRPPNWFFRGLLRFTRVTTCILTEAPTAFSSNASAALLPTRLL